MSGLFKERCTAVSGLSFVYHEKWSCRKARSGQAFVMYGSPELAELAVECFNGLNLDSRRISARISDRRLECRNSDHGRVLVGQSRWGEDIFICPGGY